MINWYTFRASLVKKGKYNYEKHLNEVNLENITTDCVIISQEEMQDSSTDDEEEQ